VGIIVEEVEDWGIVEVVDEAVIALLVEANLEVDMVAAGTEVREDISGVLGAVVDGAMVGGGS
jgi:hypothetical protein